MGEYLQEQYMLYEEEKEREQMRQERRERLIDFFENIFSIKDSVSMVIYNKGSLRTSF